MNLFAGMVITGYDFEKFYSAITSIFEIYFSKIFFVHWPHAMLLNKVFLVLKPFNPGKVLELERIRWVFQAF